jgi:altronate dehydratase small subunit
MAYKRGLMLNPVDNVANVLEEVLPGDIIQLSHGNEILTINAEEHIPFGFKVAAKDIHCNAPIIKYGQQIGLASRDVHKGTLVHIDNMAGARGRGDLNKKREGK